MPAPPPGRMPPGASDPEWGAVPAGSEASIAVHWPEEARLPPPVGLAAIANVRDDGLRTRFRERGFPECFRECADLLTWMHPYAATFDDANPPFYRWFVGGSLNASANCLDRHLDLRGDRPAIWFVPEREAAAPIALTYRTLHARVNALAALLRESAGVRAGDRVTIHLPMTPELPITMLACARLGAVHSVVFGGFSGEACGRRIADSGSRVLVTMDGYDRAGRRLDHRPNADTAIAVAAQAGRTVDHLLIWERDPGTYASAAPLRPGRDLLLNDVLPAFEGRAIAPVAMPSEAPLFLMYTSGTTGRPKGAQHGTGGYLAWAAATSRWVLDLRPEEVYWCLADIGWITGHSYIVYGPLSLGATTVLYEGVPAHPDPGRPWRIAERLGVRVFQTSPTAIRQLRQLGPDAPTASGHRFRVIATVGEPIEPATWRWYHDVVGKGEAAVVDTWWQTETGGILTSTLPAIDPMKPGSTGPPLPGIDPVILDDDGKEVPKGSGRAGHLVLRSPWPGLMQTVWGDPDRFVTTYFARFHRETENPTWRDWPYVAGDGAVLAEDGYLRILGRLDDVINVAGHRLGTKEIESACLSLPEVAEAAVVPVPDELRGKRPVVYVSLRRPSADPRATGERVTRAVETAIGRFARPKAVHIVPDMPKTRSGKIMRRVLAAISNGSDPGDVTTLSNPAVVEEIRRIVAAAGSEGS